MKIRLATEADCNAIWNIFHEVAAGGDTYAVDPNISREDALTYWFAPGTHTYVVEQPAAGIIGTYILRPNQSGGGSHVANAGFMVSTSARGQGIGRAMAEHCFSLHPIQLCDFDEYRCDSSMAGARLRDRWHVA